MSSFFIRALKSFKIDLVLSFFAPIFVARLIGVKIGKNCRLVGKIGFGSEPFLITIGNHVSITSTDFVTHDGGVWVFREENPNIDLFAPIKVGNNVFIGANCLILPGTIIEDNVVVGGGSVVKGLLRKDYVYAGVPAKPIRSKNEYWEKIKNQILNTKNLSVQKKEQFLKKKFHE